MRKIKELLRLCFDHELSLNQAARACNLGRTTAQRYLKRFKASGLPWPLPGNIDDAALDSMLFALPPNEERRKPMPCWEKVHKELSRKGVTLKLLWEEYRQTTPEGFSYAQFLRHYRRWNGKLHVSMRQRHKAGEKLFVDFAGHTMDVVDPETGEVSTAQIFLATLGFSNLTFVRALPSQGLEDWIEAHNRALKFLGGAPEIVVPDNLKSGVKSPCRYEPEINPTYQEWAEHNNLAVVPARVRKPKDKSKVEVGVQIVERRVMAPLRNRRFFSFDELNAALAEQLAVLNQQTLSGMDVSRLELFKKQEQSALAPLPAEEYEPAAWKKAKVHPDYHIEVDKHYYSVPYSLVYKYVEIRVGKRIVEILHEGTRTASHRRSRKPYSHTTCTEHMPKAHQEASGWNPGRFLNWAQKFGPATTNMVKTILGGRKHPEQGFRSCLGLLRLESKYGAGRLEKACERALHFNLAGRKPVLDILKKNQDMLDLPLEEDLPLFTHANIRGAGFYR
ncbi:IS21 family transposase [Desulfovibrio sp. JC022]|uniref:IS21 family transposase n=1 Tax=Desulfovibrio sp. JC022 TaxID=2593642 RepID=UPI0013D54D33|nr:IS21 family transposase [Desulfovibrio sp. JC022]NDV24954.1 IS21 family transposase [Desulfovibrio sp. JC022]